MRFQEHYGIAKDVAGKDATFFYLMGSLFPDYVERHRIHRSEETLELIKRRIFRAKNSKSRVVNDYLLGTCMHYICDYCCYSHGDKYYEMVHHRIFENAEQLYFKKNSKARVKYLKNAKKFYQKKILDCLSDKTEDYSVKNAKMIRKNIDEALSSRLKRIERLNSVHWWTDERIMEIDLYYAYALCYSVYRI